MNIPQLIRLLEEKAKLEGSEYDCLSTQEIESTCDILPVVLSNLRRALNQRKRVNALPPEILVYIFSMVPDSTAMERFCGPYGIVNVWELVPITLVCHYWRHVALAVSSLWSSAFIVSRRLEVPKSHDGNACYLSRCTAGPISLYVEEYTEGDIWRSTSGVSDVLEHHADRVRELHFNTHNGWHNTEVMPHILTHPFPDLQRLSLESSYAAGELPRRARQALFGGCALPHLRSLVMLNAPFLPTNSMSFLTRLLLSYDVHRRFSSYPVSDLVDFLSGAAALEEAYISGIPVDVSTTEDHASPPVELRNMRKLSIRAWDYDRHIAGICLPLMSRLLLPDSCYVRLDAGSGEEIQLLSQVLARSQSDYTGARVHCVCSHYFWQTGLMASSLQTTFPSSGGIRIDIPLAVRWDNACFQAFHSLLLTPPFAAARALWLSGVDSDRRYPTTMETCGIPALLGALRFVEELYIMVSLKRFTNNPVTTFMDFLCPDTADDATPLPFPELMRLYVCLNDRVDHFAMISRRRAEAGYIIPHLLLSSDLLEGSSEQALYSREQVKTALQDSVGELTILEKEKYWDEFALETVLPPTCTEQPAPGPQSPSPDHFDPWPRWTEGQETPNWLLTH